MTDAAFPGREATVASAGERCVAEFEGFVGLSYEQSDSISFPTHADRRELGGRVTASCIARSTPWIYSKLTGSMRCAAR